MRSRTFRIAWNTQPYLFALCAFLVGFMLGSAVWNLIDRRWGWMAVDLFLSAYNLWAIRLNLASRRRIERSGY